MVPDEWPISVPADAPPDQPARQAGGDRLSAAMADFFLDPAQRLTEQERALIGALLDGMIGWVADEIGSGLAHRAGAANDADGHALRQRLCAAGLLQSRDLMALLLRQADEERIATAARSRFAASPALLQRMISSRDGAVSAAAMELILARGRRRDRFGQPRLDFDDFPAEVAAALVNAIAAALRTTMIAIGGHEAIDSELAAAATGLIARRDNSRAIRLLTEALAQALSSAGLLDEELMTAALREGDVRMVAESLALRASIGGEAAWTLLLAGPAGGTVLLLRMADMSRRFAAELVAAIGDQLGIADPARAIDDFDKLDPALVQQKRCWLQLDPDYRAAVERIDARG